MKKSLMTTVLAGIILTCLIAIYQKHSLQSFPRSASLAVQESYKSIKISSSKSLKSANSEKIRYYCAQMASAITQRGVIIFFAGTIFFLIIVRVFVGFGILSFISTLEHELVHGIVAIISGGSLKEIKVTAGQGGYAQVTKSNFFINIAPYCMPLFCLVFLVMLPFMQHNVKMVVIIIAGIAYGSYLRGNFPNITKQPDIRNGGGKLITLPVIVLFNLLFLAGTILFLARTKI